MDGFGPQFVMGDRDLSKRGGGTTRRLSEHVVTTWLRQLHVLIDFLFFCGFGLVSDMVSGPLVVISADRVDFPP